MSQLVKSQIDKIYALIKEGKTQREISRITGHSRNTIRNYTKIYISRLIAKGLENAQRQIERQKQDNHFGAFLVGMLIAIATIFSLVYLFIN